MPATLTTASAILKEVYEPKIQRQLNDKAVALKRIVKSSDGIEDGVGGKYVTFPLHIRRNQGLGARNEMEALPTPGQQAYTNARVSLKYLYGGVRLTGQTFELADTKPQAFASVVDEEMDGLTRDLIKDQNRQVYGDGSGAVATATAAQAGVNTFTVSFTNWLQLGMQVDLIDGTTLGNANPTVKASNRQVTAIVAGTSVTIDGATVTTAIGDILVRTGSVNREWSGLGVIVKNTGTFQNVDPTVEPLWKAEIDSNAGVNRALSEGLMTLMNDRIVANGGKVTLILANLGVRRAYANLLMQQRRFTNTTKFTGGFSGLAFTTDEGDIPMVVDIDCPPNRMYFINEEEITYYRAHDWQFMDRDGSKFSRVAGFDAYEAMMYQYSQLGTHRRNTHGLLSDITEG